MPDLFDIYPELRARIDSHCRGVPWCITGVSALLHDAEFYYFEITKPKHWYRQQDGAFVVGVGGIGGSLEAGETILDGLQREVREELKAPIAAESSRCAYVVYEQRVVESITLEDRGYPLPALFTVSANIYRRADRPQFDILAIVTFLARVLKAPTLGDLYGLLIVPARAIAAAFAPPELSVDQMRAIEGVRLMVQEPLPDKTILVPVWTGRSLQLLVQAGFVNGYEPFQRSQLT